MSHPSVPHVTRRPCVRPHDAGDCDAGRHGEVTRLVLPFPGRGPLLAPSSLPRRKVMSQLTVSEVVRRPGVRARDVSDLCHRRRLRDGLCPIAGVRRLMPGARPSVIVPAFWGHGLLPPAMREALP
jgi:hypothetical protein